MGVHKPFPCFDLKRCPAAWKTFSEGIRFVGLKLSFNARCQKKVSIKTLR